MLRKLFSRRDKITEASLDVALEEWAPVPASETGTDWGRWLQQEDRPPTPAARPRPITGPLPLLESQRLPTEPAAEPKGVGTPRQPRLRPPPPQVMRPQHALQTLAEHLTDEELRIILKQMRG